MKIPYEVTFLVYVIQKFCSSSPHTAKFKKHSIWVWKGTGTTEHPVCFGEGIYKFHHQPHPSSSSRKCSWKSLKSKASNWVDSLAIWLHFSWIAKLGKGWEVRCWDSMQTEESIYHIELYKTIHQSMQISIGIYIYVNLYSNFQYVNLCNPCLRHFAVVHKVHGAFSTRGRCQGRENLRKKEARTKALRRCFHLCWLPSFCRGQEKVQAASNSKSPKLRNSYIYIYIYARPPPPPKIYLFDVWHELIHEIYPLLSCLKWILTWTPIQISHTNNTHEPHTFSYPKWTYCLTCITQPLTRHMKEVDIFINNTKWLQRYVEKWMDEK